MEEKKPFPAWSRSVEECLREYDVKLEKGLSSSEVESRRERCGWNELDREKRKPMWRVVFHQLDDELIKLLLVAAVISMVIAYLQERESGVGGLGFEAYVEPLVIIAFLFLNALVGAWQETNAEKALEALKEMQCERTKVLRDGFHVPHFPARELLPGDIVELRAGDKVPADLRVAVLNTLTLRAEQSSLTGESAPVTKAAIPSRVADSDLQSKDCILFLGTTIVSGSCVGIVVGVGMDTEIGKIQRMIQDASLEEDITPLKKKLDEFSGRLSCTIGFICILVWFINYKNFLTWESTASSLSDFRFSLEKCTYYLKIAVALAVAAIPEGLPSVITTCLSLGTRRLAQKNAIIRKLPSVETLGCTTVICSDKTGTLTTNQMAVCEFFTFDGETKASRTFKVSGTTYDPKDGGIEGWKCHSLDSSTFALAEICALCNDAGISFDGRTLKATGLPTEAALKVLVEKMGVPDTKARNKIRKIQLSDHYLLDQSSVKLGCCAWWMKRSRKIATLEFDRIRKSMGVIVREPNEANRLLVKGAAESVLARSSQVQLSDGSVVPMDDTAQQLILQRLHDMCAKGMRCLGLAFKNDLGELENCSSGTQPFHDMLNDPTNYAKIEGNLVFVGIVGLRDPPREEVGKAIGDCRGAGIRVIVITGDNKSTAEAICREIGLFPAVGDLTGSSFTGTSFMTLSTKEQVEILSRSCGSVISRAEPKHKQYIVKLLKDIGEIVAMTGDGVNDAPALKLADIGVAMGITGTEVAKEASDMVLADDNFNTIVSAIEEGRSIYNNMKAFIRYLISSNIGEVFSVFLTSVLGIPECLVPVHLLWVNLVTDGPPATALSFNPPDIGIMLKPPRKCNDALISSWVLFRYLVIGAYIGAATVGIFILWYTQPSFMGINLISDGHTPVKLSQLRSWGECPTWKDFHPKPFTAGSQILSLQNPCDYFTTGKAKATTLSLSVLVALELFNSLNALSEDNSLLSMPPWTNPFLPLAMLFSMGMHALILYVPPLARTFGLVPLRLEEWFLVIMLSIPVVVLDEALKLLGRWQGRRIFKSKTA